MYCKQQDRLIFHCQCTMYPSYPVQSVLWLSMSHEVGTHFSFFYCINILNFSYHVLVSFFLSSILFLILNQVLLKLKFLATVSVSFILMFLFSSTWKNLVGHINYKQWSDIRPLNTQLMESLAIKLSHQFANRYMHLYAL